VDRFSGPRPTNKKGEIVGRGDRRTIRWKKDRRRKKKERDQRVAEAKGAKRK
jgi:hypothetical protein